MLDKITLDKIRSLRLFGMLNAFEHIEQSQSLQTLSFTEGLSLLVDHEVNLRENKRLDRLIKNAKLRYPDAMVEDIDHEHKRAINSDQLKWIRKRHKFRSKQPTNTQVHYSNQNPMSCLL